MDLCHAIPYFALEEAKRDNVWDDGLHLTEEGYRMMGDAIAAHMIKLLHSLESVKNIRREPSWAEQRASRISQKELLLQEDQIGGKSTFLERQ